MKKTPIILFLSSNGVPNAQQFNVETDTENYVQLTLPLLGHHQYINGTTAIAAIECLKHQGYEITKESVYEGCKHVNVAWTYSVGKVFTTCRA